MRASSSSLSSPARVGAMVTLFSSNDLSLNAMVYLVGSIPLVTTQLG